MYVVEPLLQIATQDEPLPVAHVTWTGIPPPSAPAGALPNVSMSPAEVEDAPLPGEVTLLLPQAATPSTHDSARPAANHAAARALAARSPPARSPCRTNLVEVMVVSRVGPGRCGFSGLRPGSNRKRRVQAGFPAGRGHAARGARDREAPCAPWSNPVVSASVDHGEPRASKGP